MISAKEWKCECNNIVSKTETSLLKSIWIALVKRNSSTRNKIIKVGTQTDVRVFCARTLLCFWRKIRLFGWGQLHLKSTILKFLARWFWSKVSFHLEEKKAWFASYLSSVLFLRQPKKMPVRMTNFSIFIDADLGCHNRGGLSNDSCYILASHFNAPPRWSVCCVHLFFAFFSKLRRPATLSF